MGTYIRVDNGNALPLEVQLQDLNNSMFPQALVYSSTGTLLTTVNLTNVANGIYINNSYTPSSSAQYTALYIVYQDSGHTIQANYYSSTDRFDVRDPGPLSTVYTNARGANLDNLDTTVSSRAPASTALSTAQWTNGRASNLDNLDTTVSSRASQTSVTAIPTNPLLTTDTRLNSLANLDTTVSSRASQTSVTAIPTNPLLTNDVRLNDLDASISSRATQTSVNAIPTNPLLTNDARLNNLDVTISSRATQTSVSAIPTNPLLTNDSRLNTLTNLDTTVSSRASQTSVNTIPTTPQLASVALSQYNSIISALGSIQNNTNFSGIIPLEMDEQFGAGTQSYIFYAGIFASDGTPADPDSNIINVTVLLNDVINVGPVPMTRMGVGLYQYTFTVTSSMGTSDVTVLFNYSVSSVAYQQVRASKIISADTDSANITAIKAKTDNLPADPASNTVVNTRASQTSVNAIPTNPLLATDSRLNTLDANISSRLSAIEFETTIGTPAGASVSADIAQIENHAASADSKLGTPVSTISGDIASVKSDTSGLRGDYTTARAAKLDNLDATVSSRSTQTSVDAVQESINNLGNNSSFDGIIPDPINLPDTGSMGILIYARVFDSIGGPLDPDSNTIDITIKNGSGGTVVPATLMTRTGQGQYQYSYTVNSTDPLQVLDVFFDYSVAAVSVEQIRTTQVAAPLDQQFNQLNTLLTRLTEQRADNLDNLDVIVSSRASQSSIAAIPGLVWDELLAGHTIVGSAGEVLSTVAVDFEPATIASAVWNAARSSYQTVGSFGESGGFVIDARMSVAVNPQTDTLQFLAWLEKNEQMVSDPTQATVLIYNGSGTLILTLGPNTSPVGAGVFQFTSGGASQVLNANFTYVALVQIIEGGNTYSSMRPFTVF